MSSLEKRHTGQRGSMQGHRKYSDGFSDTSSSGSCMDDTDREVSNLTDRAFRSLCIGEEAIYNDSEFSSSPTERHKAFAEETQQKTVSQEAFSHSIQQYGEKEAQPEMASTFQHSYVDVSHQEQAFREGSLSYMNNGSHEVAWQQGRSSSRVSSLIKAFSSGECYRDSGTCDVILASNRYRDFGSESWDKSALLSIQRELSDFSGYHQNNKSGPFQSYRNHFYASEVATGMAQMDTTVLMKTSKSTFKALNSTNCFFHSEFSPFQLWEEYNKFAFENSNVSGFMSANEFPRWYDSPIYKELKDNHRVPNSQCDSRRFSQRQIQDVVAGQRSRSTVIQKASAIEKRCESEIASNYPPWKKNNNFVWNKLPVMRPSTVSPTNEKTCRLDSHLFSNNKVTHEILVEDTLPKSVTPFNITQLLTPVIHTRQETETSEILQFAHTPSVSDYSSQGEADPKLQTDVKHLRDSYKSKASSLLFNLKDNRKRVKSTYSPTRFKGLEIADRNKQPSKLEGRESRFSDILVSQETAQENLTGTDARASCNPTREPNAAPITLKDYTDGLVSYDNSTLTSPPIQDGVANYKSVHGSSEGRSSSRDPLANVELSTHHLSALNKSSLNSEGQLKDLNSTFSPTRPKIANVLQKAYPATHSLLAQTSEQYGQSDIVGQNDIQQRKDYGRKTFDFTQNETVKERCPWDKFGSVKESDNRSQAGPFRGEIAALIEMDKQRKATAKQYSANDSYSVRKETYMQKVNEDIKLGRLPVAEIREDNISPRKTSYSDHYGGLQSYNEAPEQNVPSNYIAKQNTYDQRAYAPLHNHKGQKTEELYSYQPYKYDPNKQWHMATAHEDRYTKESLWMQNQLPTTEQTAANTNTSSNTTVFSSNNGCPNPRLQDSVLQTDTSDQNNANKQEDRFSINDILAIRDNEQARKLKDNPFTTPKSENSQNEVKYDADPVKEQEQQGYKAQDSISPSPGYIRKDTTNISRIMSKDTDKVTTRGFSHKERGQSKQEILTSKLKAHAQKEISAIKEKGLAKQGILARNTTKSSMTINNDGQEGHPVKKEITADKLNHLFQDITYSSVTQYKELYKTHDGSPPSTEKQHLHFEDNQNATFEKKDGRVKYTPLAVERQNDPAEDNVFSHQIVSDMRNNAQKDYQPISEVKQVRVTSSEDINTNKESVKQNQELLTGHLTEKFTCQNPPALHEKQTFQPDHKERSYEKASTTPTDTTKKDLHFTSTEASKSNSGLNKSSLLGLERNASRAEEVNVHHKSKIDASVEQPKNEAIKNSLGITASQLTTSSSDMKFKNGNPPAKPLMEPAKSKLTSNLQTVTLSADAEQLKNRTYISSDSEASLKEIAASKPTNNSASQRTREPDNRLQCIDNENGQGLMVKNNTTMENVLENQKSASTETNSANQTMDKTFSKQGTVKEPPTQNTSAKDKENQQQKEQINRLLSFDKNELSKNQNLSRIKDGSKQGEKGAESVRSKQKEPPRPLEISQDNNNHKSPEINLSNSEPKKAEDKLLPIVSSQFKVVVDEGATQKDKNVELTADALNISLASSKEEPEEEPMIYKICVSSKTEATSDDEPMIFTICVSSKCHIDEEQNSAIQEEKSSVGTERCLKDEGFRIENDRAENEHEVVPRQTETSLNIEEKEDKIGKCEPPATMKKSNVMGKITTSYEDLLAKYGLPVSDHHGQVMSKHTQEDRERKQKEETKKHGINKLLSSCTEDTKKASSQEASIISQPFKETELQHDVPSTANPSTSDATKDVELVKPDRKTQTIEPSQQSKERDIQSKEKKVEEQVGNSKSVQSSRKTENIIDDVSNYTKSAKKTDNVSLTANQSGIGEPTRATIPEVLKNPISNTSMAKNLSNTKPFESKTPKRTTPQPEKKLEEVDGKNKMFNHTDTSKPHVNIINDISNYTKSGKKTENVSLTAKQSTIVESTSATITDILKTPISNTSVAKNVSNTEPFESKTPKRTTPQTEKKLEEMEGKNKMFNHTDTSKPHVNIINDVSNYTKSATKTKNVSLTAKQSAIGESTRAIITDVLKVPISNTSITKDVANTKFLESKFTKRITAQHEKNLEKEEGKNKMFNHTDTSTPNVNRIDDVSNYTKSAKKTENVSLTAKQSAIVESTRATITDVLKTPISNTSITKDVANTKLLESKTPRRLTPQPEKKLKEVDGKNKLFNHTNTSMSHENVIDDVSNYTKSATKTENVSPTAKQSAIGEPTRAIITDVLKTPVSNTSMVKDVANTRLLESKTSKMLTPQPEKKREEVEGKNKIFNHTDTSMPHVNISDEGSNHTKSATKTKNLSPTAKQSAIGESTKATKTDVLKTPISNTSITKDVANTKLLESKTPKRITAQPEKKLEEVKGKNKMFNHTDVSMPHVSIIDDVSNYTKSAKKTDNLSLTAKQSALAESTNATISDVLKTPISNKSIAKDVANTKLFESNTPRKIIPQPEKKLEDKTYNHSDKSMPHVNKIHGRDTLNSEVQKGIHDAKQQDSTMALKQESVLRKDGQSVQKNGKGDLEAKRSQEKLQVELNKSHEITNRMKMASKDGAATHVNNYKAKASRIGEDVCTVVKQDQAPFEAPKIHLKDIKVSTEEVSSNKEFMVAHKNQHEVIKRENLQGKKGAVVTERLGKKDLTQQKDLPIKTLTAENEPKIVDLMKGLGEMVSKPFKRDSLSESKKTEINPREEAVQTREKKVGDNKQLALNSDKRKKESPELNQNGQKDGDLKVNENRSNLEGKKKGHIGATETKKADTNHYQPGRSFVPETERSSEQQHTHLSQKDSKREHVLSKSESTQSNKKVTRPEISAIADYARLKVIAAEDDVKELDIFPKMDFYNNYAQPALKISKDSHGNMFGDAQGESKREAVSKEKHNPSMSTAEPKPVSLVASGLQDGAASTQPRTPSNHRDSNTKQTLEHPKRKSPQGLNTVPLQAEGTINRSRQQTHDRITANTNFSLSGKQESLANLPLSGNMASPPGEEMEELQYYTVNALDIEPKPNNTPEPSSVCLKTSQNKSDEEKKEDSLSPTDFGTVHSSRSQSNSSSPAMGKPTMFRVKDNTMRQTSVTKTVKPRFHRSFSDDFRIGSPKEHLSGSEKDDETSAIATQTLQKVKETLQNSMSSAEYSTKQSKSYQRRSHHFEEEETNSVISTMSEDMENCTVRPIGLADLGMAFMHRNESYRDSYQRPASACYERPESVCYERPESACSDIRSMGKPPTVPPKSEKALRRAQRLTTRRLKKAETPKIAPENQEQPESQSIKTVSSVPPSPSDILPTHKVVQTSPPLSQYDVQPNYTPPAHSVLAEPFPMTQRKLLQDPNSGQYFMVDVPLPVKTKTFYDPETGKYVQLNVRQRSQGAVTQPQSVEMLNAPYMLYRGFLPMASSSLSPLRSSSEMSTPPALTVHQDMLEAGNESWRQNVHHRDPQQYPEILYGSHEQIQNPAENGVCENERHRDIITMSELEDFAMEST